MSDLGNEEEEKGDQGRENEANCNGGGNCFRCLSEDHTEGDDDNSNEGDIVDAEENLFGLIEIGRHIAGQPSKNTTN